MGKSSTSSAEVAMILEGMKSKGKSSSPSPKSDSMRNIPSSSLTFSPSPLTARREHMGRRSAAPGHRENGFLLMLQAAEIIDPELDLNPKKRKGSKKIMGPVENIVEKYRQRDEKKKKEAQLKASEELPKEKRKRRDVNYKE